MSRPYLAVDTDTQTRSSAALIGVADGLQHSSLRARRQAAAAPPYGTLSAGRQAAGEHARLATELDDCLNRVATWVQHLGDALRSSANAFEQAETQAAASTEQA
jgi:hypothetical protein